VGEAHLAALRRDYAAVAAEQQALFGDEFSSDRSRILFSFLQDALSVPAMRDALGFSGPGGGELPKRISTNREIGVVMTTREIYIARAAGWLDDQAETANRRLGNYGSRAVVGYVREVSTPPEESGSYLVRVHGSFPKNSNWLVAEFTNGCFYSESSDASLSDVTHWTTLPGGELPGRETVTSGRAGLFNRLREVIEEYCSLNDDASVDAELAHHIKIYETYIRNGKNVVISYQK